MPCAGHEVAGHNRRAKCQRALSPLGPPFSAAPSPDRTSRSRRALRLLPLFWPRRSRLNRTAQTPRGAAGRLEVDESELPRPDEQTRHVAARLETCAGRRGAAVGRGSPGRTVWRCRRHGRHDVTPIRSVCRDRSAMEHSPTTKAALPASWEGQLFLFVPFRFCLPDEKCPGSPVWSLGNNEHRGRSRSTREVQFETSRPGSKTGRLQGWRRAPHARRRC